MTARPGLPRFLGPFKSFSVAVSSNREKGTEDRLLVYSQGSRVKVVQYLWLKFLWDELSKEEMKLFLMLPEILNSEIRISTIRAILILGKRKVRNRLNRYLSFLGKETFTREQYHGFKRLDVEIHEYQRSLPKVPKFSGWIRSSSAVGSKRSGGPSFLEPLAINDNDYEDFELDWYSILTVGDQELFSQWNMSITLKRPEGSKRS